MVQNNNIEAVEKRLWTGADNLRANSNYASNEYFLPVMGFIFLRHAYSRYLGVKPDIEASLLFTSPARNFANSLMFSSTLADSSAAI